MRVRLTIALLTALLLLLAMPAVTFAWSNGYSARRVVALLIQPRREHRVNELVRELKSSLITLDTRRD